MKSGLRVVVPGVARRRPDLSFTYEGVAVPAAPGETVAAALVAAGKPVFRETRDGQDRGLFCGMGVCHDCLVSVNGDTVRACMVPVQAGMAVSRHRVRTAQSASPACEGSAPLGVDVAVVGAGPAGLSAALAAASAGLAVALVDERKQAGGQYYKQPAEPASLAPTELDAQFRSGRRLWEAVRATGVMHLAGTAVWSTTGGDDILVDAPEGPRQIRYRRLILATGAAERAVPFPGWTLPGVMTTGAAQTLLRAYGVVPAGRLLIAGAGPLNLQLAAALVEAGAPPVGLIEASPEPGIGAWRSVVDMVWNAPDLVAEGLRYRRILARAGVPIRHGMIACGAAGTGQVERVAIAPWRLDGHVDPAAAETIEADSLCVGYGFLPAVELAAAIGCDLRYDARWKHLVVARDDDGRTSRPHVFAVGDGAGFGGARAAEAEGTIAGLAAAVDCGAPRDGALIRSRDRARRALGRARRFQAALWRVYGAAVPTEHCADANTLLCRCEEVSRGDVEAALAAGAGSLGAIKRATRLGMGRCQGRYCAPVVADLIARQNASTPDPDQFFAPRTPLRPVSVGAIARLALEPGSEVT